MKQQSIIQEMKDDVTKWKKQVSLLAQQFYAYKTAEDKRWAGGASTLHRSLIEYYGQIEGKKKWASVIREKRMRQIRFKKHLTNARNKYRDAKAALEIALIHL